MTNVKSLPLSHSLVCGLHSFYPTVWKWKLVSSTYNRISIFIIFRQFTSLLVFIYFGYVLWFLISTEHCEFMKFKIKIPWINSILRPKQLVFFCCSNMSPHPMHEGSIQLYMSMIRPAAIKRKILGADRLPNHTVRPFECQTVEISSVPCQFLNYPQIFSAFSQKTL